MQTYIIAAENFFPVLFVAVHNKMQIKQGNFGKAYGLKFRHEQEVPLYKVSE